MVKKENLKDDSRKIIDYYTRIFSESGRLVQDIGPLEWVRTVDIFERYLPRPPAVVVDVGGATGAYASWLLKRGYEVHLIDVVPRHVEIAREVMVRVAGSASWSARIGDGRNLGFEAESADVVLLMGPLYHLQKEEERLQVLRETWRVLRPGGITLCATISRFASFMDGLDSGYIHDPEFRRIIANDLENGHHHNPTEKPEYFTDAYFQHPDELREEIETAGFVDIRLLAVEGVLWVTKDLEALQRNERAWKAALDFMRTVEEDSSIIGTSPHLLAIANKSIKEG